MTKKFETGKTYTIYAKNSTAHFIAIVTKRTACRVTFELSDMGREWCKTSTVTLSVKKNANMVDADGNGLEMVVGKSKADRNAKFTRDLFALTDSER
jgi:hypothetical protein